MDQALKEHLNAVFTEFLGLFPEPLRDSLRGSLYFAGGCIVNFVLGDAIVDYDMFISNQDVRDSISQYFQEVADSYDVTQFSLLARSQNAVTLKLNSGAVVQVVTRFTGDTDRIFKDFDFEHTKSYFYPARDDLRYDADLIKNKKLVYTGEKDQYTLNTLKRMCKFVSRGWKPTNETIINMHRAIQNRPHIDDPVERSAQTIGFYGSSFT